MLEVLDFARVIADYLIGCYDEYKELPTLESLVRSFSHRMQKATWLLCSDCSTRHKRCLETDVSKLFRINFLSSFSFEPQALIINDV
jgi:hypothetical protein